MGEGFGVNRCAACDQLVEVVPGPKVWDFAETVLDRRMPPGVAILAPVLCWHCRGLVIESRFGGGAA